MVSAASYFNVLSIHVAMVDIGDIQLCDDNYVLGSPHKCLPHMFY